MKFATTLTLLFPGIFPALCVFIAQVAGIQMNADLILMKTDVA